MGVVVEACRTSCTNNGRPRFRDTRVTLDGPSKLRVRDVCADEPGRCGRAKLEAIGFGIFIPFFFVTSGVRYDAGALFSSGSTIALVPLFLAVLLAVRGLPALFYARIVGVRELTASALLQATSVGFLVVATEIGRDLNLISAANAAAVVAAGLLSVLLFPSAAVSLLRRSGGAPAAEGIDQLPLGVGR